jgi:hypothetical protein
MRGVLGSNVGEYAARVIGGGWERTDAYPYWFLRGFQLWTQTRFGTLPASYRTRASADLKSGTAPAVTTIATMAQAQSAIGKSNGAPLVDD